MLFLCHRSDLAYSCHVHGIVKEEVCEDFCSLGSDLMFTGCMWSSGQVAEIEHSYVYSKFNESVVYPVMLAFRFSPETLRAPLYKFKYLSCRSQSLLRPSTGLIIEGGRYIGNPLPLVCLFICSVEVGMPSKKYVPSCFHMSPSATASSRLRFPTSKQSFSTATIFSRSDSRNCCWRVLVLPKNLSSRMRLFEIIPPSSLCMVSIIGGNKSADTELVKCDTPHGQLCSD